VIGDALNHTSIVEGCIQSRATFLTFPHNDVERLRQLLTNSRPGRTLVVVDGVYSMEGDVAPIPEIAALCRQYGAKLMVDEAHSFGVIGQSGMGVQDHFSLPPDAIDIKMGTLSKAMGAQGGFICGNHNLVTALKHNAKGYLFSGAIPPPVLGAALANLQTLIQNPDLARQTQRNRSRFVAMCLDHGLPVLHPENLVAAIVPILMPTNEIAYRVTKICRERGLFVVPVIFPAVPKDAPRLRCCVMANHSESELEMAAATISAALRLATS
jgi:glycine C-acetyltransferase